MTVKHILSDCINLSQSKKCSFGSESATLKHILGNQVDCRTIDFIKMIGSYERYKRLIISTIAWFVRWHILVNGFWIHVLPECSLILDFHWLLIEPNFNVYVLVSLYVSRLFCSRRIKLEGTFWTSGGIANVKQIIINNCLKNNNVIYTYTRYK